MKKQIEFEKGEYGTRATIKTLWQDSFLELLLKNDVKELELNDGKGWRGNDVNFLQFLPNLKSLIIIDFRIKSIEAIHCLKEIIEIQISTYCKVSVNFKSFPNMQVCGFEWIEGSDSLFECKSLRKLFINNYKKSNSDIFLSLKNLEELSILNSNFENLRGLSELLNLKKLRIANLKKILSLQGIEELHNIEELEIQRCKGIRNIFEIFKLNKLKYLFLLDMGDLDTIKGLENLNELTVFMFYESTNIIDGDLSPLLKLKKLSKISFQNRKHYSHRREDFVELYG